MNSLKIHLILGDSVSVIRELQLKDYVTLLGTMFGTATIILSIMGVIDGNTTTIALAALIWVGAMTCDLLDGVVARKLKQSNEIGRELDSLSDAVSFVVAPGVLILCASLNGDFTALIPKEFVIIGVFVLIFFGITRLAWYNIANVGEGYTGLTTPMTAGFLVIFYLVHYFFNQLGGTALSAYYTALNPVSYFLSNTLTIMLFLIIMGIFNIAPFLRYGINVQKRRGIWKYLIIILGILMVFTIVAARGFLGTGFGIIVGYTLNTFFVFCIVGYIIYGFYHYLELRRHGEPESQ